MRDGHSFTAFGTTLAGNNAYKILEKKMKHVNRYFIVFTLLVSFVSGCTLNNKVTVKSTPIIRPVYTPIYTPANTKPQALESMVYDKNYLKDCKSKYPPLYSKQAGFHGVYPNVTTVVEAIEQFGQTYKYSETNDGGVYSYDSFNLIVRNHIVETVVVRSDPEIMLPLKSILKNYGCPDLIVAQALSDDPFTTSLIYNKTFFVYSDAGMRIDFDSYPIQYLQVPTGAIFTKPILASDYLKSMSVSLASKASVLVSFSEAIVDK